MLYVYAGFIMRESRGQILSQAGQLAVVAPLIHLIICFIYISGYSLGFGGGIGSIFSISDIFSISLTDLIFVYIIGFIFPIISLSDHLTISEEEEAELRASRDYLAVSKKLIISGDMMRYLILSSMAAFVVLLSTEFFLAFYLNELIPYVNIQVSSLFALPFILRVSGPSVSSRLKKRTLLVIAVGLVTSALALGLAQGQKERRYPISSFSNRITCNDMIILRSVTQKYIAISANGNRVIIDEKCELLFKLPVRRELKPISLISLANKYYLTLRD